MQASPPQGFPFFGMGLSALSALSRTNTQMAVTMSDGMQCMLASAQISEQQAAVSGTHAQCCGTSYSHISGFLM